MLREVQNLRAFAVLAVIVIHVTAEFVEVGHLTWVTGMALALDSAAEFAVPLFIFISGFVLSLKKYSPWTFYFNRLMAIMPAYILFSVIYALYFHRPILISILNAKAAYHLHFFAIIFGLYLIYPAIMRLYYGKATLFTSLLIQLFIWHLPYASYIKMMPIWFHSWTGYIFYFVLGIYVCKNYAELKEILEKIPLIYIITPTILLCFARICYWMNRYYKISYFGMNLLENALIVQLVRVAFLVSVFAFLFKLALQSKSEILKNLGDHSFGIYLVHVLILEITIDLLLRYNIDQMDALFYIILFITAVIVSYAIMDIWHNAKSQIGL
jgi:surface polysaccharide O-acyltransferase-like enzyme